MTRLLDTDSIIRPGKFAHVVLRTRQISVLSDWYAMVLGAKTVFSSDFAAFLTYDDEHHRIALRGENTRKHAPPPGESMLTRFDA